MVRQHVQYYSFFVQQLMQRKDNSLINAWNPSQQDTWKVLKQEAMTKAKMLFIKEKPSFLTLYRFLADARHQIAVSLKQESLEYLGILRDEHCEYIDTPITLLHPDQGRYASFFPCLADRYQSLSQCLPLNQESVGLAYLLLGAKQEQDIQGVDYLNLEHNALQLTCFYTVRGMKGKNPIAWYALVHTPRTQLQAIFERLEALYQQLDIDNSAGNGKVLKEIIWYLAHAMPCVRGSAAILEMMIGLLAETFAIDFDYPEHAVPIDLIALFTPSPDAFNACFHLTPMADLKKELRQILEECKHSAFFCNQNPQLAAARKLLNWINGSTDPFSPEEMTCINTPGSALNERVRHYQLNGSLPLLTRSNGTALTSPGL
ncbi:Avirulence protein [Legionella erythra]|uniref:Avirulence protein n=2 Tax=Legionella erythra TaxID=448 RepID=A0A0W0TSM9_LEGER|nr:hypothetical protein [Legionella erythra]KTC98637.1 Avirulence protein [Legionella erythra]